MWSFINVYTYLTIHSNILNIFLSFYWGTADQTQGFIHARQLLYHRVTSLALLNAFSVSIFTFLFVYRKNILYRQIVLAEEMILWPHFPFLWHIWDLCMCTVGDFCLVPKELTFDIPSTWTGKLLFLFRSSFCSGIRRTQVATSF